MVFDDGLLWIIHAGQMLAIFLLLWTLFRHPMRPEPPVNRRIAMALGLDQRDTGFEKPVIGQLLGFMMIMAYRFPFCRKKIRQNLEASGNKNGYSVDEYLALCLGSGMLALALSTVVLFMGMSEAAFILMPAMPFLGFYLCLGSLNGAARRRTKLIGRKLPYTLDLIALLMQAGATFTEAIRTMIRDEPEDELNRELRFVQSEIEFGTSRAIALENLADRIPLDTLRSVVGAINQAEALGTPLSQILKSQSGMIRNQRSVAAEEASANASMKILIPSMLILVAVVIVMFAPMIIKYIDEGRLF